MKSTLLLTAAVLFLPIAAHAEDIVFPPDAGVINVKIEYGAKGDGVTDDTAALQKLFTERKGQMRTFYFPNGTYLVSDSVGLFGSKPHSKDRFIMLQGQSEKGTVIKLKDNSPGFNDPEKRKVVVSLYNGQSTGDVMHTCVYNLTVDVGSGNPGAAGLRYMANNTGAVRHVTIRSSDPKKAGALGLDMTQSQNGPNLVSHVTVEGFDTGVATGNAFSLVFEHLTLLDQNKLGFRNTTRTTIRGLRSRNRGPAVLNEKGKGAQLTLVDSELIGGSADGVAIVTEDPTLYVRDIKSGGYGATIQDSKGNKVPGNVAEWSELKGYSLFGAPTASLRLPVKETPEVPWETDLSKWVAVKKGEPDGVQAAFDEAAAAGKTTVYFPKIDGKYSLEKPIRVHGSVNRILGMEAEVNVKDPEGLFKAGTPIFTFDELSSDVIVVERFFLLGGWDGPKQGHMFENKAGKTVVVRNLGHSGSLKTVSPSGEWFVEDISPGRAGTLKIGPGEKMWMRQFNPESPEAPMAEVDGGQLWILGLKTEGRATHVIAKNRAKVEVLGGASYQSWEKQKLNPPMFDIDNSDVSFTLGLYSSGHPFTTLVEETLGSETRTLPTKGISYGFVPIYRSGRQ